ncbi:MAG: hypothetical protein JWM68_791 [Verrucomicrobiales bacterium]|nr:hypothetical protein [Verrucomicrobiales bacterium]
MTNSAITQNRAKTAVTRPQSSAIKTDMINTTPFTKSKTFNIKGLFLGVVIAIGLHLDATAGQAPVDLGSAATFGVLAGTTVTTIPATTINGDVGVYTGNTVTGAPIINGTLHLADTAAGEAQSFLTIAYNDAAGRDVAPISVAGNLGGQTLAPGLYKSGTSLEITSGDLTLDAQGDPTAVWIFQMASTLVTTVGRQVILIGGAKAENIFWQVGSSATIGGNSVFKGTIMADQSITMNTGATLTGRALARIGQVALDANTITVPNTAALVSISGKSLLVTITNGAGVLATTGSFRFVAATGTNTTYHIVPLTTNLVAESGSYTYSKSSPTNAVLTYNGITMSLTFSNATSGSYTSTTDGGTQSGTFTLGNTVADLNGDGSSEILLQRGNGALAIWEMNGTTFLQTVVLRHGTPATGWRGFGQADFNADGKADVVFQNKTTRKMALWLMDGTNFISGASVANGKVPGAGWRAVSAADFNSDGQVDILFHTAAGSAGVWIMSGTNFVGSTLLRNGTAMGLGWQIAGTGDFNGDGQTDIVWQHTTGRVVVWNMDGTTFINAVSLRTGPPASTGWRIRGVADFNLDGKTDLLWENQDGRTSFWFYNDAAYLGSAPGHHVAAGMQIIAPK